MLHDGRTGWMIDVPCIGRAYRRRRTRRQTVDLKLLEHPNKIVCFGFVAPFAWGVHFIEGLAPERNARIEVGISIDALRTKQTKKTNTFQRADAVATLAQE